MSGDYSRKTFTVSHNYSGVLMQQGRVQLDADWNEQIEINLRRQRAETVDITGRAVVPAETRDGFKIALDSGKLSISPGRMYVDGLLAENHGAGPNQFYAVLDEERGTDPIDYEDQPFYPDPPELPATGVHIAYLDVWQRELTYVKEPDLVEPAVGIDTTARWQTVWQVKVLELDLQAGTELECGQQLDAWDDLVAPSAGRLSTTLGESQDEDDICLVPTEGGYRALENRLYRVEVHEGGGFDSATFKWARHNASIETAVNEISGTTLLVAQSQWDASRRFNKDDWVEITDDVRELAGLTGEMRRIEDIDYASNTIVLNKSLDFVNPPVVPNNIHHARIKRWDQKNDVDVNTGLLTISNVPFHLEAGIQIIFSLDPDPALNGNFTTGDYWLFYARSATADIEILNEAPPAGIHHHYARLAVLTFPDNQEDCRTHWPPQFADACCCTVTVGDGEMSHGQYNSVQEAINQLPTTGGKVCIMPGSYRETIAIKGKTDIIITGCGDRTRLLSLGDDDSLSSPVVTIENSQHIHIQSLSITAQHQGEGIHICETPPDAAGDMPSFHTQAMALSELTIEAGVRSAIRCDGGTSITIEDCSIKMRDIATEWPGIFVIGTEVLVQNNVVSTEYDGNTVNAGRGGIQIGGEAEQVRILNNHIKYGVGDGITLGSLSLVDDQDIPVFSIVASVMIVNGICDPCPQLPVRIPPRFEFDSEGNEIPGAPTYISAGTLYDIVIEKNHIEEMGRNGIGVVGFFDLDESDEFITVEHLDIGHNHIEGCLNRKLSMPDREPDVGSALEDDTGCAAIALADVLNLVVHDNDIVNNGPKSINPICGIYVLHGEGVDICDNRIINNGEKLSRDEGTAKAGPRSGIHLVYAVTPTVSLFPDNPKLNYPRQNGVPAAKIHNNVVSHPVGRALTINALGPVSVTDNQLTSRGVLPGQASAIAGTVAILNLGVSNEFYLQLAGFVQMAKGQTNLDAVLSRTKKSTVNGTTFAAAALDDFKLGRYLANGNVLFSNNQVVLDEFDSKTNLALTAVTIMTLDDIAFHDNQCDYSLWGDFLIFPNFLFAPSLRVTGNRFKESFYGALVSGVTFGLMNTTTSNQATHCLLVVGNPDLKIDDNNLVVADAIIPPITVNDQPVSYCQLIKDQVRETFKLGDRL